MHAQRQQCFPQLRYGHFQLVAQLLGEQLRVVAGQFSGTCQVEFRIGEVLQLAAQGSRAVRRGVYQRDEAFGALEFVLEVYDGLLGLLLCEDIVEFSEQVADSFKASILVNIDSGRFKGLDRRSLGKIRKQRFGQRGSLVYGLCAHGEEREHLQRIGVVLACGRRGSGEYG